ncbi:steroidogenic acute regulatory protein, putative [Ixodes scapularis]|uniref:Steroidogenic acute regulatory protein, putative n=1 Tax=Ixodes scapularis TaxID=6945 RepID=B7QE92_IXOSC|nr:steroidogenic acute regulatory protein, putative [Ixodes scapularis]|eukprot:XP_002413856.1 steroidogenic acute regulatory protein, putative [Ixodes scapularis]
MGASTSHQDGYQRAEPHWMHYGSINFDDEIPAEVLKVGASVGKKISPVRRFFALLATFDVCFCSFLWILSAMLQYKSVKLVYQSEILNYAMSSSLFDMAVLAALRFLVLLLAYIVLRMKHWLLVALMTTLSGSLVICKTFLYDWQAQLAVNSGVLAGVLLLVTSFVLPWGQAWFLDFRVVPSENRASQLLARIVNDAFPPVPSAAARLRSEDGGTSFYSPDSGSDNESLGAKGLQWSELEVPSDLKVRFEPESSSRPLLPEERSYKRKAEEALDIALKIFHESNWKTEKMDHEGAIQTCHHSEFGKVYKYAGTLPAAPETILDILFNRLEEQVLWNPNVKEARVIESIDNQTDIVYVLSEGAKGVVSCTCCEESAVEDCMHAVILYCTLPVRMVVKACSLRVILGEQGPLLYMLAPSDSETHRSKFQWLLNVNLKGWLPQYIIDKAMAKSMLDYADALKTHLNSLPKPDDFI